MYEDDPRGPLLIAPESYLKARALIRKALEFPRRLPLLIGIDDVDGAGKSSLAAWLSWQLEMPALHLDVYLNRDTDPITWRLDDLARAIEGAQYDPPTKPVILEGIALLRVLKSVGRSPDFHVFVEKDEHEAGMRDYLKSYLDEDRPQEKANYVVRWSSAAHDARMTEAHHASWSSSP
jgi:uridine kinase